jgi:hypothetical protein
VREGEKEGRVELGKRVIEELCKWGEEEGGEDR